MEYSLSLTPPGLPKRELASPAGQGGILQSLLGLFGLGKQQAKDAAPALDRSPFRARVSDLLQRLQTQPSDAQARLALLRSLAAELETLFTHLVGAGNRHESVEQLGKQLVTLRPLLLEAAPPASAVDQHYLFLVTALRDWLALLGPVDGSTAAGRQEGFWK